MKRTQAEYLLTLAEGDYKAFKLLIDEDIPVPVACFHAQQAKK